MLAETRPLLSALIALAVFFGGGALGSVLASWLAPDSGVTALFSFLAFPAAFMISLVMWQGFTLLIALFRFLGRKREVFKDSSALEALARKAWQLLPLPVIFSVVAGLLAATLGDSGFITTLGVYFLSGCAYGLLCFVLGRRGMLPMLED